MGRPRRQKTQRYNQILCCPIRPEKKFDHLQGLSQQPLQRSRPRPPISFSPPYPGTLWPTPWASLTGRTFSEWNEQDWLAATLCLQYWVGVEERRGGERRFLKYTETFTTALLGSLELVLLTHCMIHKHMHLCFSLNRICCVTWNLLASSFFPL